MSKYCPYFNGNVTYLECQDCEQKVCENDWFYCLIVGSRTFNDYEKMCSYTDKILSSQNKVVVVSGGAKGADTLAERYAKEHSYPLIIMNADWNKYGKTAGYIRNKEMHKFIANHSNRGCIAFWDGFSKGTAHNFELCKEFNTPLRICRF